MEISRMAQHRLSSRIFTTAFAAAIAFTVAKADDTTDGLKVHEWGTFTSIAGTDGQAVDWRPLGGPDDLPCFVNNQNDEFFARINNHNYLGLKSALVGMVRMETPVLYFYAPRQITVAATVRFPQGVITEWYPQAKLGPIYTSNGSVLLGGGAIAWPQVTVLPGAAPEFPVSQGASHYYAAREVEATPLRVGEDWEKFLFYRGVGNFEVPLSARLTKSGDVEVRNGSIRLDGVILFERRGGKIGYRMQTALEAGETTVIAPPSLDGDAAVLRGEIEQLLVEQGLYPAEARAMVETWRDSWLEEGTRLLYIVPRETVDAKLPLSIDPAPAELERVFMGRMELFTAATLKTVEKAIADNDLAALKLYGRFVLPIAQRISAEPELGLDKIRLNQLLARMAETGSRRPNCP
jgi:hypothetical protein